MSATYGDVEVTVRDDFVATVEIRRPPDNFFDIDLVDSLVEAFDALDDDPACRAIVLRSAGKHFCAGADFGGDPTTPITEAGGRRLYDGAIRLFEGVTPVVAAVQGAAVGGGLGLALVADFRVAAPEARFTANFARLGFHQGFGLSVTLPRVVGRQRALDLLYTGRRVTGEEAFRIGLADGLVPLDELRVAAHAMAAEIARSGPLAVREIRRTMRGDLPRLVAEATEREQAVQEALQGTEDFAEGVAAMAERRLPRFTGR